jgi:hypothetical protein
MKRHIYTSGDSVRLIKSNNPYAPVGSILKIESIAPQTDVLNVTFNGGKYHVHVNDVHPIVSKEKVLFS